VAFSPDGKLLASGDRVGAVHLWRVADGKLVQTLLGHSEWVRTVAFSPDGRLLASGSFDKTARIWQLANGELLHTLKGHTCGDRLGASIWANIGANLVAQRGKTQRRSEEDSDDGKDRRTAG
jgi:WD40 repeat protein